MSDLPDPAVAEPHPLYGPPARRSPADTPPPGHLDPPVPVQAAAPEPPPAPVVPGRFAQLTYTSFDPHGGRGGGWRVHRTSGDPTQGEQQSLIARISTHTGARDAGSGWLTAAQIAALPRRLVHGPVRPGTGTALWHTVPAGPDASGRPGNVFAHVLLDRAPDAPEPAVRPSDTLGSSAWLRPFGDEHIRETTLDTVPDLPWPPGPVAGHDAVAAFLCEEAVWRRQLLTVLVDAVSDALVSGTRPVALVAESPQRAEQWIAALGQVMPAGAARRFFWSTAETRGGLAGAGELGLHLVVVDHQVADDPATHDGYVVVRDVRDRDPGGAAAEVGSTRTGEPHRTRDGTPVAVTPWSLLVAEVAGLDAPTAARVLARADGIAHDLGDPPNLGFAWPLAAACLDDDALREARDDAVAVLTSQEPPGLARTPELRARIRDLLDGTVGRTPQDALAYAESGGGPSGVSAGRALALYVELALSDWNWLIQPRPLPVPEEALNHLSPDIAETARRAIDDALARTADPRTVPGPAGLEAAVGVMRLLELISEYGIDDPRVGVEQSLAELVERVVAPLLLDPVRGLQLVRWIGGRKERTQRVVRKAVDRVLPVGERGPGDELVPGVQRWLNPVAPLPPLPGSLSASFAKLPPTLVELALQVTGVVPRPQDYLPVALWARFVGRAGHDELRGLAGAHAWTSPELRDFAREFDLGPIAAQIRPWVLALAWDDDLAAALRAIEARFPVAGPRPGVDRQLFDAARFRGEAWNWTMALSGAASAGAVDRVLDAAERALRVSEPEELGADVTAALQAASVVDLMNGGERERPTVERRMANNPLLTADRAVVAQLHAAIDRDVVAEDRFAFVALVARVRPSAPDLAPLCDLATLTLADGEPVVSQVLLERLRRPGRDAHDLLDAAERFGEDTLRSHLPGRDADEALSDLRREIHHLRRGGTGPVAGDETRTRRRSWF